LGLAACFKHITIVELRLGTNGVDANHANEKGRTPFALAAEFGQADFVSLLLKNRKVKPNTSDIFSHSPLALAVLDRYQEVAETMTKFCQGTIYIGDHAGNSLHLAARLGLNEVAKLLFERVTSATFKNHSPSIVLL
jgi:ankyrin repeat protein